VFVDIGRDTYNLNPELMQPAVSERTAAVIAVHFSGIMLDMDRFSETAAGLNLTLIEDAAHAHGAEWHGRRAGSFGLCGTFSFQNSKSMTAGEGGLVVTNDKDAAATAASFANCGRHDGHGWFEHFDLAPNYRLSGFQAAVLMAQLERLPGQIRTRQANRDALVGLISTPGIFFQKIPEGVNVNTHYLLLGRIEEKAFGMKRDDFVRAMEAEGIPCRAYYPHPLYKNPMYQSAAHRMMPCPVAEQACLDSFWIPQNALMGDEEDTRDIARAIGKIWEAAQPVPGRVN
jgi:dTDP-4-amino-4,6-dideoxygalactose transaminase